jgi:ketosteroid isomerase-like protein
MVTSAAWRRGVCVAVAVLAGCAGAGASADDFDDLVAAERAFAADAQARGMREAFLAALAEEGVVFSPGPVNGHAVWTARTADATKLEWAPEAAEIAASGDLGYTYGPWRLTPPDARAPVAFGHFLTVWQKQADGHWKALADKGVRHGEVPLPTTVVRRGQLALAPTHTATWGSELMQDLRHADLLPPGRVTPEGVSSDFLRFRPGGLPARVDDSPALKIPLVGRYDGAAVISAAGDLAATWGGGPTSGWLRVWRRAGVGDPPGLTWRLAADVADAVTPPTDTVTSDE